MGTLLRLAANDIRLAAATVSKYLYVTNMQGDVIGITTVGGTSKASYTYDPYGKVLSATGALAAVNPLRYRGYYYDAELGLYYLKSRYYDPEICRFINADDVSMLGANGGFVSYNLFAYCGCNPVNCKDPSGFKKWYLDKDGNPQEDNSIKYSVPLYSQGSTNLCWAYSFFMRRSYESGEVLSEENYPEVVASWGLLYQFLYSQNIGLPFCFQGNKVDVGSIDTLFDLLLDEGPVYAAYKIPSTSQGHVVVVTGVDVEKNLVYTNNPWGVNGAQSFIDFCNGFLSGKYVEDSRFQLYGIYTEF